MTEYLVKIIYIFSFTFLYLLQDHLKLLLHHAHTLCVERDVSDVVSLNHGADLVAKLIRTLRRAAATEVEPLVVGENEPRIP